MRSTAGNVDQFLLSASRVRCSLSRQPFNLSLVCSIYPAEAAPRQLGVTSQLGTPSATAIQCATNGSARKGMNISHSFFNKIHNFGLSAVDLNQCAFGSQRQVKIITLSD